MRPGWYSHINNPRAVAYFDGAGWGPVTDGFALSPEIQRTVSPLLPGHPGAAAPFEMPASGGRRGIRAGWWWGIGGAAAAILLLAGLLLGNVFSQTGANADACSLYESASNDLSSAVKDQEAGILSQADVRAEFRALPERIKAAADAAHGDVLVEMQKSYRYAAAYQASQTEDNGMAYFMHRDSVVEACNDAGAGITLD
jgi:hypothetical protein